MQCAYPRAMIAVTPRPTDFDITSDACPARFIRGRTRLVFPAGRSYEGSPQSIEFLGHGLRGATAVVALQARQGGRFRMNPRLWLSVRAGLVLAGLTLFQAAPLLGATDPTQP